MSDYLKVFIDIEKIKEWQDLIGAFIGAFSAFALWWIAGKYTRHIERKDDVYFIQKAIVDQMNTLLETKRTLSLFIDDKLTKFLLDEEKETNSVYLLDMAFFPLFSTRPLGEEFQKKTTGSGFIDNKILRAYAVSQDLPHIIEDMRKQFDSTLNLNKEMVFNKFNSPTVQKALYLKHLGSYKENAVSQMMNNNIPIFLKVLTECLVAVEELRDNGILKWKWKFDCKFRFYWTRKAFEEDKNKTFDRIENYFSPIVHERLQKIEIDYKNMFANDTKK